METKKNIIDFIQPKKREEIGDDYFNNLAAKIILENNRDSKSNVVPVYRKNIVWIISSIAALLLVFLLININGKTIVNKCDFNSVSQSQILAYLDQNIDEFDTELMVEFLSVNVASEIKNLNKIDKNSQGNNLLHHKQNLFEEVDSLDIIEYLENEELTIEDLEEVYK